MLANDNLLFSFLLLWLQCTTGGENLQFDFSMDSIYSFKLHSSLLYAQNLAVTTQQVRTFNKFGLTMFRTKLPFMVPFVPILPLVAIMANIFLMCRLSVVTWVRFIIWCFIGKYLFCHKITFKTKNRSCHLFWVWN